MNERINVLKFYTAFLCFMPWLVLTIAVVMTPMSIGMLLKTTVIGSAQIFPVFLAAYFIRQIPSYLFIVAILLCTYRLGSFLYTSYSIFQLPSDQAFTFMAYYCLFFAFFWAFIIYQFISIKRFLTSQSTRTPQSGARV